MKSHADYYPSGSYLDELGQAAAFMYLATNQQVYLRDARRYWQREDLRFRRASGTQFPRQWMVYDWENKFLPQCLLLAQIENNRSSIYAVELQRNLELWMPECPASYGNCRPNMLVPPAPGTTNNRRCPCVFYTPAGLARGPNWGSLRGTSNMAFLALQYAKFLRRFDPADAYATKIENWAVSQINYIVGILLAMQRGKSPS
jgi:mannan endo-1,4-beta-mannosidase